MKILVVSSIDQAALETLRAHHDVVCALNADTATLQSRIHDREVLIFRSGVSITADVMGSAPDLKLLIRAGSGIDNVDMEYIERRAITFTRIPEPSAQAVAEMSFALMLSLARNVREADLLTRQGQWAKHQLTGYLLSGKVLGIVGAGNIGSRVGQLGAAWGMQPIGCVEYPSPDASAHLHDKGIRLTDFAEVMATADFVSIHVPLQASTRNLIDARALSWMKPGAFLTNLARGGVVDEQALYIQLTTPGRLRGAALDVHKEEGMGKISPLAGLPNVILTPHIGANTVDTQKEIGRRIVAILNDYIASSLMPEEQNISFNHTAPVPVY